MASVSVPAISSFAIPAIIACLSSRYLVSCCAMSGRRLLPPDSRIRGNRMALHSTTAAAPTSPIQQMAAFTASIPAVDGTACSAVSESCTRSRSTATIGSTPSVKASRSARITDLSGKSIGTASRPDEVVSYFPRLAVQSGRSRRYQPERGLQTSGFVWFLSARWRAARYLRRPIRLSAFTTAGTYWSNASRQPVLSLPVAPHRASAENFRPKRRSRYPHTPVRSNSRSARFSRFPTTHGRVIKLYRRWRRVGRPDFQRSRPLSVAPAGTWRKRRCDSEDREHPAGISAHQSAPLPAGRFCGRSRRN